MLFWSLLKDALLFPELPLLCCALDELLCQADDSLTM